MQSELTYVPFVATAEQLDEYIETYNRIYPWSVPANKTELCACGNILGRFEEGFHVHASRRGGEFLPQMYHSRERCNMSEADLQATCTGPTRKITGAYIGCVNCEPYVCLSETRDSPYLYSSRWAPDCHLQVYNGETKLAGVMETKVGIGGYIIQLRQTPDPHHCPCYLASGDDLPAICLAYIPGDHYNVREPEDA